jgi:hypothetical protein
VTQILLNAGGLKFVLQKRRQQFHDFTGLPLTADGWTDFTAMYQHPERYLDSRIVFVSSSTGNDGTAIDYTPSSEEIGDDPFAVTGGVMPYATIAAAYARLRTGHPDILLLRRGDTWNEGLGFWKKIGRSAQERMIVASYGVATDPPLMNTSDPLRLQGGGPAPASYDYLIFADFSAYYPQKDPDNVAYTPGLGTSTMSITYAGSDILYEGVSLNFLGLNFNSTGQILQNVCIRRCVVRNHYSTSSHAQGTYAFGIDQFLVEENCYDHNGWHEQEGVAAPTIFNHNLYIDNGNTNATFRRNISARASSHGIQLRCGGVFEENLMLLNPINILVGGGTVPNPGGVICEANKNVILGSANIGTTERGFGIEVANIKNGSVSNNIIAHRSPQFTAGGVSISIAGTIPGTSVGVNNLLISDNVLWNWGGRILSLQQSSENEYDDDGVYNTQLLRNRFAESEAVHLLQLHLLFAAQLLFTDNQFLTAADSEEWFMVNSALLSLSEFNTAAGTSSIVFDPGSYEVPTIDDYMVSIGESGSYAEFLALAAQQSRLNWDARFTASAVRSFIVNSIPAEWVGE